MPNAFPSPKIVWITGLSGAGKSSTAAALQKRLQAEGQTALVLDGDQLRHAMGAEGIFDRASRIGLTHIFKPQLSEYHPLRPYHRVLSAGLSA